MRQSDKISRHHIRGMTPHIWTVGAVPGRSGMFSTQSPCSLRAGGRGNKKDGERSADEERWGMSRADLEKRIRRLYTGIVKIGKTLGIGTGLVQRVVTPRPFDVAEPYAFKLRRGAAMRRTSITERTFCTTCHRMCCSGRSMHNFPLHPAMERVKHAFS